MSQAVWSLDITICRFPGGTEIRAGGYRFTLRPGHEGKPYRVVFSLLPTAIANHWERYLSVLRNPGQSRDRFNQNDIEQILEIAIATAAQLGERRVSPDSLIATPM